ncbi:MAG: hypothetical protein IPP46_04445 [Bacteroidetes bacterium]|nr:hypothetical protein [Bacteroidota bacterium]
MMKISRLIVSILMVFLNHQSFGQTSTVSPYSRFGPGELLFNGFAHQRGMGGTSLAESYIGRLNFSNPASYAYDSLMVFEFGVSGERLWLDQGDINSKKYNAKLEYLVLGMPLLRNKIGLAFGMIPFSGIGYSIRTSSYIDSSNTISTTYEGTGGLNKYFLGTGIKLSKQFSVGVNASYLFGSTEQSRIIEFTDTDFFGTRVLDNTSVGEFLLEFGLHYKTNLKNNYTLAIGASFSTAQQMKAKRSFLWENYRTNAIGIDFSRDTVQYIAEEKGEIELPMSFGIGIQVAKGEKWTVQSDFRFQEWSTYKSFRGEDSLDNSMRVSIGGQYVNDSKGTRFIQRMQFRVGLFYSQSYLNLRNNSIEDKGISLGFGLPLRKAYQSIINIALEAGQRGTTESTLIRERYVRAVIGITFNENWFQKRRFD